MSNPSMPNLPGFGAIAETMELVRNMWGGMNAPGIGIPGMVMPTLSVEEINKQISDLKAVESWLTLNMNMLRGSIQALEVQSATISTLKSMGETFSASVKSATPSSTTAPSPGFSFPFGGAATAPPERATPAPTPWPPAAPVSSASDARSPEPGPETSAAEPGKASTDKPAQKSPAASDTGLGAPLANPAAWWNMLQNQFKHAVGTALSTAESAAQSSGATSGDGKRGSGGERSALKPAGKASGGAKKPVAKNTKRSASKTASKTPAKTASKQARKSTGG